MPIAAHTVPGKKSPPPSPTALLSPGEVIGDRYRVVELLGEGMSGYVYRAKQLSLERDVAVKVLHPQKSRDPGFVARFRSEARMASAIGGFTHARRK